MPQITVFWNPEKYPEENLLKVLERLPVHAANALTVEGSKDWKLTKQDFCIEVKTPGKYDKGIPELGIVIEASYSKQRDRNLQERTDEIATRLENEGLAPLDLNLMNSFVWVRLSRAGFSKIGRPRKLF